MFCSLPNWAPLPGYTGIVHPWSEAKAHLVLSVSYNSKVFTPPFAPPVKNVPTAPTEMVIPISSVCRSAGPGIRCPRVVHGYIMIAALKRCQTPTGAANSSSSNPIASWDLDVRFPPVAKINMTDGWDRRRDTCHGGCGTLNYGDEIGIDNATIDGFLKLSFSTGFFAVLAVGYNRARFQKLADRPDFTENSARTGWMKGKL
ncbi:hypothetical protein C8F04DRAFT_1196559 [Mycena alexandri]|uniref:Uncharacterized protein n=1 Tax=Mycena alexandri TaxID=1745969 RepID=A0AAD6S3Q6_9AGAR|nr:hypothetical protein C8F04DRAFT_1196559 [Mycena alexandri]